MISLFQKNGFILALLGAVGLALVFPGLGAEEGPLHAGLVSHVGVMVIFFLQGLSLKTRELAGGLRHLKLHAFIQGWIFLISPLFLVASALILRFLDHPELASGFLYLVLIPTTISSAVAFTSAAGGNVSAAIFNTTLSNVFGVFWVPAGCVLFFATGGSFQPELILPMLAKVVQLILLPLVVGQIIRPFAQAAKILPVIAPSFKLINHSIILFIVFAALCQSFLGGAWEGVGTSAISLLLGLTVITVLLVHAGVWISSGWLGINYADRLTALFCGSQKTLAAGVPMAAAIFSTSGDLGGINLGLLILPLLCYHPIQLLLASLILPKLGS